MSIRDDYEKWRRGEWVVGRDGVSDHPVLNGCSESCGAFASAGIGLKPIHSKGCPLLTETQNGKAPVGSVQEMYWWNNEEVRR